MKKKSKKFLIYSLIGILVLATFGILYFQTKQSVISINNLQPIIKQDIWKNIPITISTVYLGSLTSSSKIEGLYNADFCGSTATGLINGAYSTISNSYSVDNLLTLSSIVSTTQKLQASCENNYIKLEGIFPRGILNINYDLHSENNFDGINKVGGRIVINGYSITSSACAPRYAYCSSPNDVSGSYQLDLINENNSVKIELYSSSPAQGGTGSANAGLSFTPNIIEPTPTQNQTTTPPTYNNGTTIPNQVESPSMIPFYILIAIILLVIFFLYLKKKKRVGK